MPTPFEEFRARQRPLPSPPPVDGFTPFQRFRAQRESGTATLPPRPPRYFEGGPLQKVFDVLRTGEFAVGGALSRQPGESLPAAISRGIQAREESGPQFARRLQGMGMPDSFVTDATAFAASLVLDPINLVGVGLVGKGLRAAGAVGAAEQLARVGPALTAPLRRAGGAVAERVAPGMVRAAAGRRALEPTLEEMVRAEGVGVERAVALGKALRTDALRATGRRQTAQELDEAVGLYFDAGADTMLNHIAQSQLGAETAAQIARREATRRQALSIGQAARVSAGAVQQTAQVVVRDLQQSVQTAMKGVRGLTEAVRNRATFVASQTAADAVARNLTARQAEQAVASAVTRELRGLGVAPEMIRSLITSYRTAIAPITRGRTQAMAAAAAQGVRATLRRTRAEAELAEKAVGQVDPQVVARARQAGLAAQDAWLRSQPEAVQTFVRKWAPRLATEDKRLAEELVLSGMMKPETAAKWEGLHLRRIYQQFEDPQEFVKFLEQTDPAKAAELLGKIERGIPLRRVGAPIPTAATKQRQILSEEAQLAKGVIRQASSRYIAGGTLAERAVARGHAYQKIAQEFGVAEDVVRAHPLAAQVFRQMPDTGGWGALAGKWLPKELADPLLRLTKKPEGMDAFLQRTTGWFKFAKVILNPATHMRNIRTNVSLAHNAVGLGALNPATWARAIREVATNGDLFKEAKTVSSAFTDTFTATELRVLVNDPTPGGIINTFRRAGAWAARQYQAEEQIGKMVVYLTAKGQGLSPQAAAKTAELALFNYRKVPPAIDRMRRIGIYPFITFPYKVATETLPQVIRRPGRFATQAKVIGAVSEPLTPDEQRVLPDYMRTGGYIKLPITVNGHPVLFDLSYELAYGDIAESGTPVTAALTIGRRVKAGEMGVADAFRELTPLMPPVIQIAMELGLNRSAFTGRPLVPEGETLTRELALYIQHVLRFATPSIVSKTVLPGGELRRSVEAALPGGATGVTPSGRPALPLVQAVPSTAFGLRTVPLDVGREQVSRRYELGRAVREIELRIRSVGRDRSLDPSVRRERVRELIAERRRVLQRYRETGSAR